MPRAGLDRTAVIRAAAAVADSDGLDGLSLARVAQQVNVRPPSLYNHVGGLDDLRHGLAILGIRELAARLVRAGVGRSGDDAVAALAWAYRAFAHERPGLYAALQHAPPPDDSEWRAAARDLVEIVAAVFASYGLAGDEAIHAVRGFRSLLHGFVSLEAGRGFGLPLDLDESFRRMVAAFMAGLRSGAYTSGREAAAR